MTIFAEILIMTEIALYQSVLQKLGQIAPQDLSELDAFLTDLVSKGKRKKKQPQILNSPTFWLEQLANSGAFAGIENPAEWQRQLRQDRQLSR